MEAAIEVGENEMGTYLKPFELRAANYANRNCLLKIMLNKKNTVAFKNMSNDVFKEIIKYA